MCRMVSSTKRESLPISPNEASLLEALRDLGTPEHRALVDLVSHDVGSSRAAVVHAVFEIGVNEIRDRVREEGYQALMDGHTEGELAEQRAEIMARQARMMAEEGAE
jgi:hypothetical protein